jgi:hypothetical protein
VAAPDTLRAHGQRAVLEVLLRQLDPTLVRCGLGAHKDGWAVPLRAYAHAALARLPTPPPPAHLDAMDWPVHSHPPPPWPSPRAR